MSRPRPFAVLALACAAPAAQSPQLVAWSETNGPALFNGVQVQDVDASCPTARLLCRSLLGGPEFWAGGTAYDPRHHAVWMSNGRSIQEIELDGCTVRCQFTAQLMNPAAVVSGLVMLDGGRRLLQLESAPGYAGTRSYDATVCPPVPLRDGCSVPLASAAVAGGLAVDARDGLVFWSVSTPTAVDWSSEVIAARSNDRCTELCRFALDRCGPFFPRSGVVTGLAFDACARRLFATNGRHTQGLDLLDVMRCVVATPPAHCCPVGTSWDYKGLALVPAMAQQRVGRGCAPPQCQACAATAVLLGGAPVVGNADFALGLAGAEVGTLAAVVLAGGPCTGGVPLPFLCGPLYPSLQPVPFVSPPLAVQGPGACGGSARLAVPLPLDYGLCGARLCVQWAGACPLASGVLAVSDAVQFAIGG